MASFQNYLDEYRIQLEKGAVQEAYRGLMEYIMDLRTHFKNNYPGHFVSGSIYYGYMDMTYFAFTPNSLKHRNLKIAIVFLHKEFRFEAWLGGYNKQVQQHYWELFKESGWKKYHIVPTIRGADSILENTLVDSPDFRDPEALTQKIERQTLEFIKDVEDFLSNHP